jgi:hypothetical protein
MQLWTLQIKVLFLSEGKTDDIEVKLKALLQDFFRGRRNCDNVVFAQNRRAKAWQLQKPVKKIIVVSHHSEVHINVLSFVK